MNTVLKIPSSSANGLAVEGLRLSCASAGLYKNVDRHDMVLMEVCAGAELSLQQTQNRFAAAPVVWCRQHLPQRSRDESTFILINAGNANAGTGQRGHDDIARVQASVEARLGCTAAQFLPFSTGVIGEYLPVDKMLGQIDALAGSLDENGEHWRDAAAAIITTDTTVKLASAQLMPASGGSVPIQVTAIAKGSGMIHPDMATMLCFLACDANVSGQWLDECARAAVSDSFNSISVDGDTSTNDACLSIATGRHPAVLGEADLTALAGVIAQVMADLAYQIIDDGEGATLNFCVRVSGASSVADARAVARTVATSPLVKTAIGARDANWGRILAAVGRAPVPTLDINKVSIAINNIVIVSAGARAPAYNEQDGTQALREDDININIDLQAGAAKAHCYGCDLTAEYVRINADYRS